MRLHRWTERRRGLDERGASLVEFALVLPVFVLLLFGLIDFGLVLGGFITLRAEVNAAARNISVDQIAPGCNGSTAFSCTAQQAIGSSLPGTSGTPSVAIAFPDGATVGDPVEVCAQTTLVSATGLLGFLLDGRHVTVESVVRLEQPPTETTSSSTTGFQCPA
jgi:Flp pilus assembly protein TadG